MAACPDLPWLRRIVGVALCWLAPAWGASFDPALDARIAALVAAGATPSPAPLARRVDRVWLERVYSSAGAGPVWFTVDGPRPAVAGALRELRAAADRGLAPEDYDVEALERQVEAAKGTASDPDALARADVALSAVALQFLADLRFGRAPPQRVEPHYRAPEKDAAFVAELRDAVARDRVAALIAAAEPRFPQYARLKRVLLEYRLLARQPASILPPLASPRSKVVTGDAYAGTAALRAQLVRLGDLAADSAGPADGRLWETLADGLRRFQERHGLQPDGILGHETLAALNEPIAARVGQIVLSLERMRWLPDLAAGPLIAINIPSFRLWAFTATPEGRDAALSMPVVVGRAMRTETPVFIGEMRYVEFSPYWNVPPNILRNELLPRLATDPSYLDRENMEIVSVRGDGSAHAADVDAAISALRSGEARLRQRPGTKNALGGVKFVLPNTMDVYLHATPERQLFDRARRDFSHGCIRVREPEALAAFVLRGRPEWTAAAIEAAMTSGVNRSVALATPIPVIVFYTTAVVDGEGRPHFLRDVYGHDRKLLAALRGAGRSVP
jgi:murein L,D-transpeptidase YcbB/YkuD